MPAAPVAILLHLSSGNPLEEGRPHYALFLASPTGGSLGKGGGVQDLRKISSSLALTREISLKDIFGTGFGESTNDLHL